MSLNLASVRGVPPAPTTPPCRTQAHGDAATVDELNRQAGKAGAGWHAEPCGQILARERPTLDLLCVPPLGPVDVRRDEGAHSRRVSHRRACAANPFEKPLATQLGDSVLDDAAADAVLLPKLGMGGDAVAGRPLAGRDELPKVVGEPLIRRTTHSDPQQRTILNVSR